MNEKLKNEIKTKIAISNFKKENIAMNKNKTVFKKIAIAACACLILTSGIVFAKDIENIIKGLFSNTNPAIEKAVEEGYVQNIENDFYYDKDIGVKIDNIVLDDLSLNISIKFESNIENLKYIRFNKFSICTDTGEKIFDNDQQYVSSLNEMYTAKKIDWMKEPEKMKNNIFADSILFTMGENSKEKKSLIFDIQSLDLFYLDGKKEELKGNWNFTIEITEKMKKSQTIKYILQEENEHIESCVGRLYPTGLKVEFNLNFPFDPMDYYLKNSGNIRGPGFFFIKNASGYNFPSDIETYSDSKKYVMNYDSISIFSEIPKAIEIYLEPFDDTIVLNQAQ